MPNTAVVLRGLSSTVLEIYAALAASRPTRRYALSLPFTTIFMFALRYNFVSTAEFYLLPRTFHELPSHLLL